MMESREKGGREGGVEVILTEGLKETEKYDRIKLEGKREREREEKEREREIL